MGCKGCSTSIRRDGSLNCMLSSLLNVTDELRWKVMLITDAKDEYDQFSKPCVSMSMNSDGARRWAIADKEQCRQGYRYRTGWLRI